MPPPDDLRLLAIQVETLFRLDRAGRLDAVNEVGDPRPGDPPAPRLFFGRTRRGTLARYRHDLPEGVVRDLDRIVGRDPVCAEVDGRAPMRYDEIKAVVRAHGEIRGEWRGPAFRFLDQEWGRRSHPVVRVEAGNASLLDGPFASLRPWLARSLPCVAVVRDGAAVAVCRTVRRSPRAVEAGVETLAEHRGRGYGVAVVAAWAGAVREEGAIPLYSTSWENAASRALARKLGLIVYAEDWHLS